MKGNCYLFLSKSKINFHDNIQQTFTIQCYINNTIPRSITVPVEQPKQIFRGSRILLADDEYEVRLLLTKVLQRAGYDVEAVDDGDVALERFIQNEFDLILLDVKMPRMDGFAACTKIRLLSEVPVIMLTALNQVDHIVEALDKSGADEYITKPFNTRELVARIESVLRRNQIQQQRVQTKREQQQVQLVKAGPVVLLENQPNRVLVKNKIVEMSSTEYRLLCMLMTYVDTVVEQRQIIEVLWGVVPRGQTQLVENFVHRLRAKIEPDPSNPQWILTVPGRGYMYSTSTKHSSTKHR